MNTQRQSTRSRGRLLFALTITIALLGLAGSVGPTEAAPSQASVPAWCQWLPPEHRQWIPECQGGGDGGDGGQAGGPVEERFSADGPWPVSTATASPAGTPGVTLFHPTTLGADGYDHPVVAWGNGSFQSTSTYADTLQLLASWGFVVISPNTGEIDASHLVAAAEWAVTQDSNPSSVFFQKLDTSNVGVAGHSRGAGHAGLATNDSSLFTSTAHVSLPDRIWGEGREISFTQYSNPMLLITGAEDFLTSPGEQTYFFQQAGGPAAKAALVGASHGGGLGSGGVDEPGNGFQGYLVAWFKYTLEGDEEARSAFAGASPEISTNSLWTNWEAKNLP